ncbi:hypothetical protein ACSBPH_04170 [Microbacterium sp. F51-2R]|uniref:hypothetical protein n=1 Tax=Microbacterium sp. F51-2R TaxID=3445777 RepID=UPI003F9EF485
MTGLDDLVAPYEIRTTRDAQNVLTLILEEAEKIDQMTGLDDAKVAARDIARELNRLRSALNDF